MLFNVDIWVVRTRVYGKPYDINRINTFIFIVHDVRDDTFIWKRLLVSLIKNVLYCKYIYIVKCENRNITRCFVYNLSLGKGNCNILNFIFSGNKCLHNLGADVI